VSTQVSNDNKYAEGTIVYALENPKAQLVIRRYFQRIYYCTPVNDSTKKDFVYFEREIVPA
jgi:hypothetical protein